MLLRRGKYVLCACELSISEISLRLVEVWNSDAYAYYYCTSIRETWFIHCVAFLGMVSFSQSFAVHVSAYQALVYVA